MGLIVVFVFIIQIEIFFSNCLKFLGIESANLIGVFFLQAQYISKLVKIAGITIAASRTKAKATYVTLICKNCKKGKQVPCRPGLGGAIVPRSCDHVPQV